MLVIKFLGAIHIKYKQKDITKELSTKSLAILSLLLLRYPRELQRRKLISYFWPESTEESGKYNLRYNLWILKKIIGKDKKGNNFLQIRKNYCGINKHYSFTADLLEINKAKELQKISLKELEKVNSQFKGDFLEGFYFKGCDEFNEIILQERLYFENQKIKVLLKLAEKYNEKGMLEESEKCLVELSKLDPYDENIALKYIEHYTKIGKKSSAIIFYNSYRNRLVTSLGVQPSEDLEKVYTELLLQNVEENKEEEKIKNKKIHIYLYPEVNIKYYGLVEFLKQFVEKELEPNFIFTNFERKELSYIYPFLSENTASVFKIPDIRILLAMESFLGRLQEKCCIVVNICNKQNLDYFSLMLFQYLEKKEYLSLEYKL